MTRRIFIGDVQGCRGELERLLDAVRFDPVRDRLFPVGDLVNRGPDSLGCLRLLRDLDAQPVLGNHDLRLLRASRRGERAERDTFGDVMAAPDREELLGWLARQPFVRAFPDLYLVHAGLHPRWEDPERELHGIDPFEPDARAFFATRVRYCDAQGELAPEDPPDPGPGFLPWFRFYLPERHSGRKVVFGHWSARLLVNEPGLRGLDTGCVWGGSLTAWIADEDRLVQVPAARVWASSRRPGPGVAAP